MFTDFYYKIFSSYDKEHEKKLNSFIKTNKKSSPNSIWKLKSDLCKIMNLRILDENTNTLIDYRIDKILFSQILLSLSLYPLDEKKVGLWNKHVHLFDKAERVNFEPIQLEELEFFLITNFFNDQENINFSGFDLKQPSSHLILLFIHLDIVIATLSKNTGPICLNYIFKIRKNKNNKNLIPPSRSFSDLIIMILEAKYREQIPDKIDTITDFTDFLTFLDTDNVEHIALAKKLKNRMQKIRTGQKCYMTEVFTFLGEKSDFNVEVSTTIVLEITKRNLNHLVDDNFYPEDESPYYDALYGAWLIYIFHYLLYENLKKQPDDLNDWIESQELKKLWLIFKKQYNSFRHQKWPKEFQDTMDS